MSRPVGEVGVVRSSFLAASLAFPRRRSRSGPSSSQPDGHPRALLSAWLQNSPKFQEPPDQIMWAVR